jgi:hypothetical protein
MLQARGELLFGAIAVQQPKAMSEDRGGQGKISQHRIPSAADAGETARPPMSCVAMVAAEKSD